MNKGNMQRIKDNRDHKEELEKMEKENHYLKTIIRLLLEEIDFIS